MSSSKHTKTAPAKNAADKDDGPRLRKATKKQAKLEAKKEMRSRAGLPGSFSLVGRSFVIIKRFWQPLLGIAAVYSLLNVIFASGIISALSSTVSDWSGHQGLSSAVGNFSDLLANSGSSDATAAQSLLLILESLVIIWALRHLFAGEIVGVKESYYKSASPLVPFMLIILVMVIQLLPLTLGAAGLSLIFSTVTPGSDLVVLLASLIFIMLASWSIYLVSSSVFALYIITLPEMYPIRALRSAKNLVRFRRWPIIRRLLFLPVFILVFMGIILIPLIMWINFLVTPVFFLLSMFMILFTHCYLYNLYKGLLA
jgi:hypothetical protein